MGIYVVIGRAGTWRRGPWEPDCQRQKDVIVKIVNANSLAEAKDKAQSAGYGESREWMVRKASKSEAEWAKFALKSDWLQ